MYIDAKKLKDDESSQSTLTPDQLSKLYKQVVDEGVKIRDLPSPSPEDTTEIQVLKYRKLKLPAEELYDLDFLTALKHAIEGERITKAEWNNSDIYCVMENGMLCLHKNGVVHHWLISKGDTIGNDWSVLLYYNRSQ